MNRREFMKNSGAAALVAYVGSLLPKNVYGDETTKDPALLQKLDAVRKKYDSLIGKSGYETSLDVSGDGTADKVKFTLKEGSLLDNGDPVSGEMMRIDLEISGRTGTSTLMAIMQGGSAKIAKTQWVMDGEVPKYLDALLR
jgi:hypothetical protein